MKRINKGAHSMNLITQLALVSALTVPFYVQAEESDACAAVFEACASQGFVKDETAPMGKKIWLDCANMILNHNKAVEKVSVDPNSFEAKNCRNYRVAKAKFDADWVKKHKAPKAK